MTQTSDQQSEVFSPERCEAVLGAISEGVVVVDRAGIARYVSPQMEGVLGYGAERVLGRHVRDLVDVRDRAALEEAFAATVADPGGSVEGEFRVPDERGGIRWVHARASNHLDAELDGIVVEWRDVTVEHEQRSLLEHAATHDALTGLATRALLVDHLELALAAARRDPSRRVAVLACDLDDFKRVNDELGHAVGDAVLQRIARRMRTAVRPTDTVARFGGDEFLVLLVDLTDAQEAVALAERIRSQIETDDDEVAPDGLRVGISVGVAISPRGRVSGATLLRQADAALYEAKRRGGYRVELYSRHLRRAVAARTGIENDLRRSLDSDEDALVVHYQPIVDLHAGGLCGAEALVRWRHERRGMLPPAAFLDVAERSGLIVPIGWRVLWAAVDQAARWRAGGHDISVSVNVSTPELARPELLSELDAALADKDVDPSRIVVEITERAATDDVDATAKVLAAIRSRGVRVFLDDFGTGHSSLTWLQRLPVDGVKLDRTFVAGLGQHDQTTAIVASVIDLGHALGLRTVGEGVEREEQLSELAALGCDAAQGFHVGLPGPASGIVA